MGLDTSHNAWSGPYSLFNNFRYELARRINIDLDLYEGYRAGGTKDLTTIDHPLMDLFNHSDCDGVLTIEQCRKTAEGLTMVIDSITLDELTSIGVQDFYHKCDQFRKGCLEAIAKSEVLEFH